LHNRNPAGLLPSSRRRRKVRRARRAQARRSRDSFERAQRGCEEYWLAPLLQTRGRKHRGKALLSSARAAQKVRRGTSLAARQNVLHVRSSRRTPKDLDDERPAGPESENTSLLGSAARRAQQ